MGKNKKINLASTDFYFTFFLIFIMVLYGRLLILSVPSKIDGIDMDAFAKARNTSDIKLYAKRGNIYDNSGNILSTNVSSYTVIAYLSDTRTKNDKYPNHVIDKMKTAEALSPIINMSVEKIFSLLDQDLYQVELGPGGRDISELKKNEIVALNLPGISFIEKMKRTYPNGDFASYIIGYTKRYEEEEIKGGSYKIVGELGIEGKYNDILKGKDGSLIFQRDRFGYKIPDTKEFRVDAEDGQNIYLTLDAGIQRFLESEVKNIDEIYSPEWVQFTVMDAKTGAILGSSTTPSYNPNILNIEKYENPLVSYVFEPGSTMKTFTYMCAMEKGKYNGDLLVPTGSRQIGNVVINDWNNKGWGMTSIDKGYVYSSNTATSELISNFLTANELAECLNRYGFGAETKIELPRELRGNVSFNSRYEIELMAAGYGQGITTTAIQHLQAMSMIANDGTMLKPYIVDRIEDPNTNKVVLQNETSKTEGIVDKDVIEKMKNLMYEVVSGEDEHRTGKGYNVEGFDIIGKTGTAQIFDPNYGSYLRGPNDYIYSFSGMYPKDDPEIIMYVAMKKPTYGKGSALAPATRNIVKNIAKYLNMFEEEENPSEISSFSIKNYINASTDLSKISLEKEAVDVIIIGNGEKVIKQYPNETTKVLRGDKVFLLTNDKELTIPSFKNYSKFEATVLSSLIGVKVNFEGIGYVKTQSLNIGSKVDPELDLLLTLENYIDKTEIEEKTE